MVWQDQILLDRLNLDHSWVLGEFHQDVYQYLYLLIRLNIKPPTLLPLLLLRKFQLLKKMLKISSKNLTNSTYVERPLSETATSNTDSHTVLRNIGQMRRRLDSLAPCIAWHF